MHITNIVAKTSTHKLDLDELHLGLSAAGKNVSRPNKFPGLVLRLQHGTVTFFKSGAVMMNGVKTMNDLPMLYSDLVYATIAWKLRYAPPVVVNVSASFKTNDRVYIEKFYTRYQSVCFYNPDIGNAAEVKLGGSCIALLHPTGNGILTGAKTVEEMYDCWQRLVNMLYW